MCQKRTFCLSIQAAQFSKPLHYTTSGFFGHTIEEYLTQFKTTAALCNLEYVGAIYTHGVSYASRDGEEKRFAQKYSAREHAARLIDAIRSNAA